jgi:hypothetical protein
MGDCGGSLYVIQAVFQADSVIATHCVAGISDLVFANDSDLAALAGGSCLSIKSYKYLESSKACLLQDMKVFSGQFLTITKAARWLDEMRVATKSRKPLRHFLKG